MALETRADDLYFEDYRRDAVHKLVSITVSGPDIIEFARQFDPQPFHNGHVVIKYKKIGAC